MSKRSRALDSFFAQSKTNRSESSALPVQLPSKKAKTESNGQFFERADAFLHGKKILPSEYDVLLKLFDCLQTVLHFHWSRRQAKSACFFSDVKGSVQRQSNRELSLLRLKQIVHIAPEYFCMVQMPKVKSDGSTDYELAFKKVESDEDAKQAPNMIQRMRNAEFEKRLMGLTEKHHKEFLEKNGIPLPKQNSMWHPKFPLQRIPAVPQAELPEAPKVTKVSLLESVQNRHKEILEYAASQKKSSESDIEIVDDDCSIVKVETSGIDPNLLARVRQAEMANQARSKLFGSAEERKQRMIIEQLPELVIHIRQLFKEQKRQSMNLEKLIQSLRASKSSNIEYLETKLDLLLEHIPDWCAKQTIGRICVFKLLNMDTNISTDVIPRLKHLKLQ